MHVAYADKRQDMVNRLLEAGANLEARDGTGRVPIQHLHDPDDDRGRGEHEQEARANDRSQSFRTDGQDSERIQNAVNPADPEGRTPLHQAAEKGSYLGTHRLLQQGADPNITDKEGRTPLHCAAGSVDGSEAVERLLEAGANPNFSQDSRGETPLHLAVRHDNGPSVDHLLEARAHPGVADSEGRTPLHRAADNCAPGHYRKAAPGRGGSERARQRGAHPTGSGNRQPRASRSQSQERRGRPAPREGGRTPTGTHTEEGAAHAPQDTHRRVLQAVCRRHHRPDRARHRAVAETLEARRKPYAGEFLNRRALSRRECLAVDGQAHRARLQRQPLGHLQPDQGGRGAGTERRTGHHGPWFTSLPRRAEGTEATPGEVAADKPKNPDAEKTTRPMWKRYTVFNVEQADGLALPERSAPTPEWEALKNVENVIEANGVAIREVNGDRAYYNMAGDEIVLPERSQFKNAEGYLPDRGSMKSATAPDTRTALNRESLQQGIQDGFGSEAYAREELRAEISAMMSSDRLGVAYEPQHGTAYVKGWVEVLKDDPKEIYKAAAEASRISDYVCEARERARAQPIEKDRDTPLVTSPEPGRGRPMPSPVVAHQPQPAAPVPAKAPEIELSR